MLTMLESVSAANSRFLTNKLVITSKSIFSVAHVTERQKCFVLIEERRSLMTSPHEHYFVHYQKYFYDTPY